MKNGYRWGWPVLVTALRMVAGLCMIQAASAQTANLTLIKQVINNDGGTLGVSDFPLFIGSQQTASGAQLELNAGSYIASEQNQPGYGASPWGGDCDAAGNVTLSAGDN